MPWLKTNRLKKVCFGVLFTLSSMGRSFPRPKSSYSVPGGFRLRQIELRCQNFSGYVKDKNLPLGRNPSSIEAYASIEDNGQLDTRFER